MLYPRPVVRCASFLAGVRVDFVHVRNPEGRFARAWGISVMPSSILFDRAGRPVFRHEGFHPDQTGEYERHFVDLLEGHGPEVALSIVPAARKRVGVCPWERGLLADPPCGWSRTRWRSSWTITCTSARSPPAEAGASAAVGAGAIEPPARGPGGCCTRQNAHVAFRGDGLPARGLFPAVHRPGGRQDLEVRHVVVSATPREWGRNGLDGGVSKRQQQPVRAGCLSSPSTGSFSRGEPDGRRTAG